MWKRLRLLTLIALTVILAWKTYPIWGPFAIENDLPKGWGDSLPITLISPDKRNTANLTLGAVYALQSNNVSVHQDATISAGIAPQNDPNDSTPFQSAYLVAYREVKSALGKCTLKSTDGTETPAAMLNPLELPIELQGEVGEPDSIVYEIPPSFNLSCNASGDNFWFAQDNTHTYNAPPLAIDALLSHQTEPPPSYFKACVTETLNYDAGALISYRTPDPASNTTSKEYRDQEMTWGTCTPGGQGTLIHLTNVSVSLKDTSEEAEVNHRLFLAGALAGVVGGLAVEIAGSGLEIVTEGWSDWSSRRRTRRDEEEQRPEPDPAPEPAPEDEPYNPGPRGYL